MRPSKSVPKTGKKEEEVKGKKLKDEPKETKGKRGEREETPKELKGKKEKDKDKETPKESVPVKRAWTGKTPSTQLHEYTQRNRLSNPVYSPAKPSKPDLHRFRITIENPVSKKRDDFITKESYPTVVIARNAAAVVGLHHFCHNLSFRSVLPPDFRSLWDELGVEKAEKDKDAKLKKETDQIEAERATKALEQQKEDDANIQQIFLSNKTHAILQSYLASPLIPTNNSLTEESYSSSFSSSSSLISNVKSELLKMGFLLEQVDSAVKATYKEEGLEDDDGERVLVSRALDWLSLNVGQELLPDRFRASHSLLQFVPGQSSSSKPELDTTRTSAALSSSTLSRFPPALHPLLADNVVTEDSELLSHLLASLSPTSSSSTVDELESELESLTYIIPQLFTVERGLFDGKITRVEVSAGQVQEASGVPGECRLVLLIGAASGYPSCAPVTFVKDTGRSSCFNESLSLALFSQAQASLGLPMIYLLLDWLLSSYEQMVSKETLLLQPILTQTPKEKSSAVLTTKQPFRSSKDGQPNSKQTDTHTNTHTNKTSTFPKSKPSTSSQAAKTTKKVNPQLEKQRAALPVASYRGAILEKISTNPALLITGETGSGKTTQIPAYLLEEAVAQKDTRQIVCTQPRRLSAVSVAGRVAEERGEALGQTVGFQIRGQATRSSLTQLLFCTTGILLRILSPSSSSSGSSLVQRLSGISHVIVDEVHERGIDSDFLLLLLREAQKRGSSVKVIMMSATINAQAFASYFGGAPICAIPGKLFPVEIHYSKDVASLVDYSLADESKTVATVEAEAERGIDWNLLLQLLQWLARDNHKRKGKSVLVFLPGMAEIERLREEISASSLLSSRFYPLALHSSLPAAQQKRVFEPSPSSSLIKIILSTNIAETSLTIPDIGVVIDSGRANAVLQERGSAGNYAEMREILISHGNARQRTGRAGRTGPGVCYRLYSNALYDELMAPSPSPEIETGPLHSITLQALLLSEDPMFHDEKSSFDLLAHALTPPPLQRIRDAKRDLLRLGALRHKIEDDENYQNQCQDRDRDVELSGLGRLLAAMPVVDVRVGKLLVFGVLFRCVESAVHVAAGLSADKAIWKTSKPRQVRETRLKFLPSTSSRSDMQATLIAFNKYLSLPLSSRSSFCETNNLDKGSLDNMVDSRLQLLHALESLKLIPRGSSEEDENQNHRETPKNKEKWKLLNQNSNKWKVVASVICAALYPQVVSIISPIRSYVPSLLGSLPAPFQPHQLRFFTYDPFFLQSTSAPSEPMQVDLDRRSVNSDQGEFDGRWLVYHKLVVPKKKKTSESAGEVKPRVEEMTLVSPIALLLFGGKLEMNHQAGLLLVDKWIRLKAPASVGVLFRELRVALDCLVASLLGTPSECVSDSPLLRDVISILESDGVVA